MKNVVATLACVALVGGFSAVAAVAHEPATVGPQSECTQTSWASWGTSRWYLDSSCTLHLDGGTGADESDNTAPWHASQHDITSISIDGDLTLTKSSSETDHGLFANMNKLQTVTMGPSGKVHLSDRAGASLFAKDGALTSIQSSNTWDTEQASDFNHMFEACNSLTNLDLSNWNVKNITDFDYMFLNNTGIVSLNLFSHVPESTSGVDPTTWSPDTQIDPTGMFDGCTNLANLTARSWFVDDDDIHIWCDNFRDITSLKTLDLSDWVIDPSWVRVSDFRNMLANFPNLVELNITNWDTSHAETFYGLFSNDPKLTTIIGIDTISSSNNTALGNLFYGDDSLTYVNLLRWSTNRVDTNNADLGTKGMFPANMRMVAIAGNMNFKANAFENVEPNRNNVDPDKKITWYQMSGFSANSSYIRTIGSTDDLIATLTRPHNYDTFFVDSRYLGATLTVDANGGSGSYNEEIPMPTSGTKTVIAPAANKLTGNKPGAVFTGWNTAQDDSGTSYTAGQTIIELTNSITHRNITLYAQWRTVAAPSNLQATYHASDDTVTITGNTSATSSSKDNVEVCLDASTCLTDNGTSGTFSVSFPASQFISKYRVGSPFTVTARASAVDPTTGKTITSADTSLSGTLPYTSVTLAKDGATGTVPTIASVFTDVASGTAKINLPQLSASGGISRNYKVLAGWNPQASQTVAKYATPGSNSIAIADGSTTDGHTTITLHPVWNSVQAPTNLGASMGAGRIHITGKSRPWTNTDVVNACARPSGSSGAWVCKNADIDTTGNWNGADEHTWSVELPNAPSIAAPGNYEIKATLATADPWRATSNKVISPIATAGPIMLGTVIHTMPFTGGQPLHYAIILVLCLGGLGLLLCGFIALHQKLRGKGRHAQ